MISRHVQKTYEPPVGTTSDTRSVPTLKSANGTGPHTLFFTLGDASDHQTCTRQQIESSLIRND